MKLSEIAKHLECELRGDGAVEISTAAPIESALAGQISFLANNKYISHLDTTGASALVLSVDEPWDKLPSLRGKNPYLLFAGVIDLLYPDFEYPLGISETAKISADASVGEGCHVGDFCSIQSGSSVGENTTLRDGVYLGRNVKVGSGCHFYPGVSVMDDCEIGNNVIIHSGTVIGSDGFGFASSAAGHKKFKQIGNVIIGDDVELGSNCSVDRAALGSTVIGSGTKIDNMVHIAHGVQIGKNCLLAAQIGISGSTRLGNWVAFGGQVGVIGHLTIGDRAAAAAQSGIIKDVPPGTTVFGMPARDIKPARRIEALVGRLPELFKRLKKLEEISKEEVSKLEKSDIPD